MLEHAKAYSSMHVHTAIGNSNTNSNSNSNCNANSNCNCDSNVNDNADAYSFHTLTYKKENYHTKKPSESDGSYLLLTTYYLLLGPRPFGPWP